jgi:hypothetical protein
MAWLQGPDNEPARRELTASFSRWETAIRSGLEGMLARGDLKAGTDTGNLALALMVALQGGLLLAQTFRDPAPLHVGLSTVIAHIRTHAT